MTNIDYYDDIYKYLTAKFPDAPAPLVLEASGYIAHRMIIAVSDAVEERDKLWRHETRRIIEAGKYRSFRTQYNSMNQDKKEG